VAGFCDVDLDKAKRLAERHHGAIATSSLDELFALSDVPAVVIGVPNARHKDSSIAALKAGKDILLEKPMAMSVAECDAILEAQRKSDRLIQMGFVSRQAPTSRAALDFIRSGRLGNIYHVKASLIRRRGIPGLGGWFTSKEQSGGGALIDIGVHLLDLGLHLLGRPRVKTVSAATASAFGKPIDEYVFNEMWAGPPRPQGKFDVEDSASAFMRLDGANCGASFQLDVAWASNIPEDVLPKGVTILGDEGGCHFDVWGTKMVMSSEMDGKLVDVTPQIAHGNGGAWDQAWTRQHELFAEAVSKRSEPVATAREGRDVQVILDAMYRSAAEQREVAPA
jgi:predicted dehydrogenase